MWWYSLYLASRWIVRIYVVTWFSWSNRTLKFGQEYISEIGREPPYSRLMNSNFETIWNKNSSAHELLSKKYSLFFTFHGQKWCQIFEPIKTLGVIFGNETWKIWQTFSIKVLAHSSSYCKLFQNWNSSI